jgi:hypothetical protein
MATFDITLDQHRYGELFDFVVLGKGETETAEK